jgi:hypothetical protein
MIGYMRDGMGLDWDTLMKVITVCQDIAESLDKGVSIDAIIIDFFKTFNLVPHERLLTKLATSGEDLRVVVWVREFLVDRTQRVRGGQQSKEVKVTPGVLQGSILGPLPFLVYVNDIWRNTDLCIRLFTDDCVIYRKITNKTDTENLQKDLDSLRELAV